MIEFLISIFAALFIVFIIFALVLWGEDDKYMWETMFFNETLGGTLYNWHLEIKRVWNNFWKYFWK